MADIEKVIKGIEHCLSRYVDGLCDDCPYMGELDKSYMIPMKCKEIIMRDALELLKEQQPKTGHWKNKSDDPEGLTGLIYCSECGGVCMGWRFYCSRCGAKMDNPL